MTSLLLRRCIARWEILISEAAALYKFIIILLLLYYYNY